MSWMDDAVMQWTCSNRAWAAPDANLLLKKLVTMDVKLEVEMSVASNLDLTKKAWALEAERPGAGEPFMKAFQKDLRAETVNKVLQGGGMRLDKAAERRDALMKQFENRSRADKIKYMNSCGICAGYALMWLANAIEGDALRKPEQSLAAETQGYLSTKWLLSEDAAKHTLESHAAQRAHVYRKTLKTMRMWRTTVKESATGRWDWEAPDTRFPKVEKRLVHVPGAGAKTVWAKLSASLKQDGGAMLAINMTGLEGATVGHAIAFYQDMSGGAVHAFDANIGLGLYASEGSMPGALEKLQKFYGITDSLHEWTIYSVGINEATPVFKAVELV